MSRWFRLYDCLLDDPKVQRLAPDEFRAAFFSALHGDASVFSDHIRPDLGRPSVGEWALIRTRIFARDNFTCGYCGERGTKLECDHIVPVSRGGSNDDANLVTACFYCNRSKGGKMLAEWRMS